MKVTHLTSTPVRNISARTERKAVTGGGVVTPAVAAHLRKKTAGAPDRKAVTGGGVITPAVAAHLRKKADTLNRGSSQIKEV